jgi:hypothetical protein
MRLTTTLAAAAAIAVSGVAANAGGLTTPVETPIVEVMTPAPAGSMSSGLLIRALIAALLAAASSSTAS